MKKIITICAITLFAFITVLPAPISITGTVRPEKGTIYQRGIYLVLRSPSLPDRIAFASFDGLFRFDAVDPAYEYELFPRSTRRYLTFTPSVITDPVDGSAFVYFVGRPTPERLKIFE